MLASDYPMYLAELLLFEQLLISVAEVRVRRTFKMYIFMIPRRDACILVLNIQQHLYKFSDSFESRKYNYDTAIRLRC